MYDSINNLHNGSGSGTTNVRTKQWIGGALSVLPPSEKYDTFSNRGQWTYTNMLSPHHHNPRNKDVMNGTTIINLNMPILSHGRLTSVNIAIAPTNGDVQNITNARIQIWRRQKSYNGVHRVPLDTAITLKRVIKEDDSSIFEPTIVKYIFSDTAMLFFDEISRSIVKMDLASKQYETAVPSGVLNGLKVHDFAVDVHNTSYVVFCGSKGDGSGFIKRFSLEHGSNKIISYGLDKLFGKVSGIALHPNGMHAYFIDHSTGDAIYKIWKIDMGSNTVQEYDSVMSLENEKRIPFNIAIDPNEGSFVAVTEEAPTLLVRIFDLVSNETREVTPGLNKLKAVDIDRSGTRIIVSGASTSANTQRTNCVEIDINTGNVTEIIFNETTPQSNIELSSLVTHVSYSVDGMSALIMDNSVEGYFSIYSVSLPRYLTYYDGTYVLVDESDAFSFYDTASSTARRFEILNPIQVRKGDLLGLFMGDNTYSAVNFQGIAASSNEDAGCTFRGRKDIVTCKSLQPNVEEVLKTDAEIGINSTANTSTDGNISNTNGTGLTNETFVSNITQSSNVSVTSNSTLNNSVHYNTTTNTNGVNLNINVTLNMSVNIALNVSNSSEGAYLQVVLGTDVLTIASGTTSAVQYRVSGYVEPHHPHKHIFTGVTRGQVQTLSMQMKVEVAIHDVQDGSLLQNVQQSSRLFTTVPLGY
jgi:hypothetical protein